jgi:iron complex outermembrane receptor protein
VGRWAAVALAALVAASASAQSGRVAGVVTDAEAGTPVVGAAVRAEVGGSEQARATDAEGRYALDVLAGPVALRVHALGYARLDTVVTVAVGQTTRLDLALAPETLTAAEVVVQARRTETATRADAPVLLVPQAVSVLPAAVLDAQGARDAADALRNVPGVAVRAEGEPGARPVLRGFETDLTGGGVRRNGVEVPYLSDGLQANVARVEVLRGPASVLYGRLEPGGVVNFVTKEPLSRRRLTVEGAGGSLGSARLAVEAGGPAGGLDTRLDASAERDVVRGDVAGTTLFAAPAARWRRGALTLDADAEAVASETTFDPGLAALGTGTDAFDGAPTDRFFGEPDAVHRWRSAALFTTARWRRTPALGLRGGLSLGRYVLDRDALELDGLADDAPPTVARTLQHERLGFTYLKATAFTDLRAATGPVAHEVTLGAEGIRAWAQAEGDARLEAGPDGLDFAALPPVALDAPAPTGIDRSQDAAYLDATVRGLDVGAFVQERATVRLGGAAVHAVVAARLSHVRYGATIFALADTPDAPAGTSERDGQVTAVTPSAGLVVEPAPGLALYASTGASFNPIVERVDRNGEPFEPTRGVQVEGGLKVDGRRAAATLAAFWIRKDDALTAGPGGFFDQTGRQRSRGVEVELRAEPLSGLVALASYALLDAEVVEDDNVAPGTPLPFAPRHAASAWAEWRTGPLALRGGVWAQGARSGSLGGTVDLPAQALVDLGAEVALGGGVALRLDVRNALDARGYTAAQTRPGRPDTPLLVAWPTRPREVRLGVTVRR